MTKAINGHQAYREWVDILLAWSERVQKKKSMTEEQAGNLRALVLIMLKDSADIRTDFVLPGEVLLTLHTELEALFMGYEPEFLLPENRRQSQKLAAPQIQRYIQDAVAWIHGAESRGESTSQARKCVRDAFVVSKATVSAWEDKYPDVQYDTLTENRVLSAGRLYRKAVST